MTSMAPRPRFVSASVVKGRNYREFWENTAAAEAMRFLHTGVADTLIVSLSYQA